MIEEVKLVAGKQDLFFQKQQTKSVEFRINQLRTLKKAILDYEDRLYDALWKDLRKSKFEAYGTEIGLVLAEIGVHIRNLRKWAKPRRVYTNQLIHFWSTSRIYKEPYGRTDHCAMELSLPVANKTTDWGDICRKLHNIEVFGI
jgi:aldehyde dehydrogenase (NAD+)